MTSVDKAMTIIVVTILLTLFMTGISSDYTKIELKKAEVCNE
jgi:hypothetical protein